MCRSLTALEDARVSFTGIGKGLPHSEFDRQQPSPGVCSRRPIVARLQLWEDVCGFGNDEIGEGTLFGKVQRCDETGCLLAESDGFLGRRDPTTPPRG